MESDAPTAAASAGQSLDVVQILACGRLEMSSCISRIVGSGQNKDGEDDADDDDRCSEDSNGVPVFRICLGPMDGLPPPFVKGTEW